MPLLYLAKVNLNSRIFEVYNKTLSINDVCKNIYEKIADDTSYSDNEQRKYIDTYGNSTYYYRDSQYAFQEINKTDNIITGKLVRTFNKPTESLDKLTKKMVTIYNKESVSIYFYYDVFRELITFCERQSFGYNQFSRAFAKMLNKCLPEYEFEIFLQKDQNLLDEKLSSLSTVQKVRAKLIPPNSNEDDIAELREESDYLLQCEDLNAYKLNVEYASDNMNMESKVMQDIKAAVLKGYGDMTITGKNFSNRLVTINSSQEAAFTNNIRENIGESDFIEESKGLIDRFLSNLIRRHK